MSEEQRMNMARFNAEKAAVQGTLNEGQLARLDELGHGNGGHSPKSGAQAVRYYHGEEGMLMG